MTTEELILERLDRIEAQLAPISRTAGGIRELQEDLIPLSGQAIRLLIRELEDVESGFQLEDLLKLLKRFLRSTKHLIFALEQFGNFVDFATTVEPLLKSAVPQAIDYLDDLEQKGVFRMISATLDLLAKIAAEYTAEDIEQIGDAVVALLPLVQKLSDPNAVAFLKKAADVPANVDLAGARPVGPFGMLGVLSGKEAREGLGILMQLTKAVGSLSGNRLTSAERV